MKLQLGDWVHWSSQANGHRKAKEGPIVEVVPRFKRPERRPENCGGCRSSESYVVSSGGTLYWPRAKWLRRGAAPDGEGAVR